jgi:hypothetical protein
MGALENDHFVSLARAHQVLHGDWPVRDFADPGQPLTYLASSAASWLFGAGMLTEVVLSITLLSLAAALTYVLAARASGSLLIAVAAVGVELIAAPRSYNAGKILMPLAAMGLGWRYLDAPSIKRLTALAACHGISIRRNRGRANGRLAGQRARRIRSRRRDSADRGRAGVAFQSTSVVCARRVRSSDVPRRRSRAAARRDCHAPARCHRTHDRPCGLLSPVESSPHVVHTAGALAFLLVVVVSVRLASQGYGMPTPGKVVRRFAAVARMLRQEAPDVIPNRERLPLIRYLATCTPAESRVHVSGFGPELPVLARRPFAAGLPSWIPGYTHPRDLQRALAQLAREQVSMAVMLEGSAAFVDEWPQLASELGARRMIERTWRLDGRDVVVWIPAELAARAPSAPPPSGS